MRFSADFECTKFYNCFAIKIILRKNPKPGNLVPVKHNIFT